MTLADVTSWLFGPTAEFSAEIKQYYQAPDGAPPLIDMVLVKLAFPGPVGLAPVFGLSDWIMVAFFVIVAGRFGINDNLFGLSGKELAQQRRIGRYLPIPVIALIVLLWYGVRYLLLRRLV
jgi:hypothetical protein